MLRATRDQIVAFRASALHLTERLPVEALVEAVRPCGLQDTPPGNAAVAAAARVAGLTPDAWRRALEDDKVLVATWAMRGSPFVFASADLRIFQTGLLPGDERTLLHLLTSGQRPEVEESGVSATVLVDRLTRRARAVLKGNPLARGAFGTALAASVPEPLRARYSDEERLSVLTLTVARLVALRGAFVLGPRVGRELSIVASDEWLASSSGRLDPREARAEFVRRFLRAFAPATADDLAWWAATSPDSESRLVLREWARGLWSLVEPELIEVAVDDSRALFVLAADAPKLASPAQPRGIRLLPPHDPFLMQRERELLLPKAHHPRVWRAVHSPGVVLSDGAIVATWTAKKRGSSLAVTVEPLHVRLSTRIVAGAESEAARLAIVRGCRRTEVSIAA
jgi:hypothetical protein